MHNDGYDCIIIGAGVGGLTAGAYLSKMGKKTILFEKNADIGGMAGTFFMNGYTFDAGGTPQYDQLGMLRELGVDNLVEFIPMGDPAIAMYFPGFTLYGPKPMDEFVRQLDRFCSAEELDQFAAILATFERLDMAKYVKLNQSMNESMLKFIGGLFRHNPLELVKVFSLMTQNLEDWLGKRSGNRHVLEVVKFINGLTLLFPCRRMPALLGVLIMSGFTGKLGGRWHLLKGGNVMFSRALARAMETHGGRIETGRPVKKILIEDGAVTGVVLEDGTVCRAGCVISDTGIRETVSDLTGTGQYKTEYVEKVKSLRPSPSLFKLCLGLKQKPDLKAVVNFIVPELDEPAWWQAIDGGIIPEKTPLMFWCKYLVDPGMAPAGRYDIDILVAAPFTHRDGDWETIKHRERDRIIARMNELIPGIEEMIDFEWMLTPPELEAYSGQQGGGILPVEPSVDQMMKFPDMRMPLRNLFCVGATVRGGAGINGAAYTGKLCAQRIAGTKNI